MYTRVPTQKYIPMYVPKLLTSLLDSARHCMHAYEDDLQFMNPCILEQSTYLTSYSYSIFDFFMIFYVKTQRYLGSEEVQVGGVSDLHIQDVGWGHKKPPTEQAGVDTQLQLPRYLPGTLNLATATVTVTVAVTGLSPFGKKNKQ